MNRKNRQAVIKVGPKRPFGQPAERAAGAWLRRFSRPPAPARFRPPFAIPPFQGTAAVSPAMPAASRRFHPGRESLRARPQSVLCAPGTAPVKAPRAWPKSSASNNVSGMAAQFRATSLFFARGLSRCRAVCHTASRTTSFLFNSIL